MSQQELLIWVVQRLDALGIDYMVTGSVASSLLGEPRASHDIDLVVALLPEAVERLATTFPPPDFYLSDDAMRDAIRQKSMFNLLCISEGDKVDFWMLTDEPFDAARFARKRVVTIQQTPVKVSAPEDVILAKLRWAKLAGGSEKQVTDALRVFEVQRRALDSAYLEHWAKQLQIEDSWQELQKAAEPL